MHQQCFWSESPGKCIQNALKNIFYKLEKFNFYDEPDPTLHQLCIWSESRCNCIKNAFKNIFLNSKKFIFMKILTLHFTSNAFGVNLQEIALKMH